MRTTALDYADLIGKPYAAGEWGPDSFDCFSLVAEVYHRLGLEGTLPVRLREHVRSDGQILISDIDRDTWIDVVRPAEIGDVALVRGREDFSGTRARHCAVLVGHDRMLHTTLARGAHTIPWRSLQPFTIRCIRLAGGAR